MDRSNSVAAQGNGGEDGEGSHPPSESRIDESVQVGRGHDGIDSVSKFSPSETKDPEGGSVHREGSSGRPAESDPSSESVAKNLGAEGRKRRPFRRSKSRFAPGDTRLSDVLIARLSITQPPSPSRKSYSNKSTFATPTSRRSVPVDSPSDSPDQPTPTEGHTIFNDYHHISFDEAIGGNSWGYHEKSVVNKEGTGEDLRTTKEKEEDKNSAVPEKRMIEFALRLASIEKAASTLGALAFLWATVVVLTSTDLELPEFVTVLAIILTQASRIFSRSHELEFQKLSTKGPGKVQKLVGKSFRSLKSSPSVTRRALIRLMSHVKIRRHPSNDLPILVSSGKSTVYEESSRHPGSRTVHGHAGTVNFESSNHLFPFLRTLPSIVHNERVGHSRLVSKVVSRILYFAQLASALTCFSLAIWRLVLVKHIVHNLQLQLSLYVFYGLAILEACFFIVEKCYLEYTLTYKKLLAREILKAGIMTEEDLSRPDFDELLMVKAFFDEVYSKCLAGSVFDGLDMGLVEFSISCLQSEEVSQQHGGARLLNRFVSKGKLLEKPRSCYNPLAADTLRRLGTTPGIIERLIEMLSWNARDEYPLLNEVSTIICRLVIYNRNCARIVAVPGAMDAIVSLLWSYGNSEKDTAKQYAEASKLRLTGLRILKYLCRDHKNSLKVGAARGLLSILTMLIAVRDEDSFRMNSRVNPEYWADHLKTYKNSLQVLRMLAATRTSGGELRHAIAAIVSCLKNLRDVIQYGDEVPALQWLAADTLYHLAMEDDLRERIGSTGGVIRNLFSRFALYDSVQDYVPVLAPSSLDSAYTAETPYQSNPEARAGWNVNAARKQRRDVVEKGGETLARLLLRNEMNTQKLLAMNKNLDISFRFGRNHNKSCIQVLVEALDGPVKVACSAADILRSVLRWADQSTGAEISKRTVNVLLKHVVIGHRTAVKEELYQACLGLAGRTLLFLDEGIYADLLSKVNRMDFVQHLMKNLRHAATTNRFPRIRRYSVELILGLIEKDDSFLDAFQKSRYNLRKMLERTLDNISEVENFRLFSGLVGYTRHQEDMETLVQRAITAVDNYRHNSSGDATLKATTNPLNFG